MVLSSFFEIIEVADEYLIVPIGDAAGSFQGVIAINECVAFLLQNMKSPKTVEEIVNILLENYKVDEKTAIKDVNELISGLIGLGVIEN